MKNQVYSVTEMIAALAKAVRENDYAAMCQLQETNEGWMQTHEEFIAMDSLICEIQTHIGDE